MWAPVGQRPTSDHKRAYQWVYAYHFLRPSSGESHWLLMPTVNTEVMGLALANWIKQIPDAEEKIILLLVDQAGWHMSAKLSCPSNVILHPLPPYTPELQPVEATWPLLREAVANRFYPSLEKLTHTLIERCRWLSDHPEIIKARTAWQWLIDAENFAYSD
jgi:transposase